MNAVKNTHKISDETIQSDTGEQKRCIDWKINEILGKRSQYIHNRVTLASTLSTPILFLLTIYSFIIMDTIEDMPDKGMYFLYTILLFLGIPVSMCISMMTQYGKATRKNFLETVQILQETGVVQDNRFQDMMGKRDKNRLNGYCEAQGIYLGMKEFGMEKEFKEMKKRLTKNILPNF